MWVHAPQLLSFLCSEVRIVASIPWGCVSTRLCAFRAGHCLAQCGCYRYYSSDQELSFGRCASRLSTSSLWRMEAPGTGLAHLS